MGEYGSLMLRQFAYYWGSLLNTPVCSRDPSPALYVLGMLFGKILPLVVTGSVVGFAFHSNSFCFSLFYHVLSI